MHSLWEKRRIRSFKSGQVHEYGKLFVSSAKTGGSGPEFGTTL